MNAPFDSRLMQNARTRIAEELTRLHRDLGRPNRIINGDASATGLECSKYIWQIYGLEQALKFISDANDDMNGKNQKPKKDAE